MLLFRALRMAALAAAGPLPPRPADLTQQDMPGITFQLGLAERPLADSRLNGLNTSAPLHEAENRAIG